MLEILKTLRETPLPIVLVVGGLIFLLVPFIRKVSDKIEVETTNKGLAGFIGFVLLAVGIGLYIVPPQSASSPLPAATETATSPDIIQPPATPTSVPTLANTNPTAINVVTETASNDDLVGKHYIFGYTENELAAQQILAICKEPNCRVIFIKSLNELPDDWYHLAGNIGSDTANLNDGCYSKQDLINLQVTHMQTNNYAPCPAITPTQGNLFDNSTGRLYILGYTSQDISVQTALTNCNNCPTVYLTSLNELPDDWYHYAFHLSSPTDNPRDGCRTKQDLINLDITRVIMNNWEACP